MKGHRSILDKFHINLLFQTYLLSLQLRTNEDYNNVSQKVFSLVIYQQFSLLLAFSLKTMINTHK